MARNRLGEETSPYLLQHDDNPVHWWAWGPDALAAAKAENKPILLSVGYAACHWCHVMAHESFEDDATALVMNELFINIKVDREERPDIDTIYMASLHALGEQGGWPLTMFLTPAAKPFWGGTYFPKDARYGRPSFTHVLQEISRIYHQEPDKVASNASAITAHLTATTHLPNAPEVTTGLLAELMPKFAELVDPHFGGMQGAPKFPQFTFFWLLWRGAMQLGSDAAKAGVLATLRGICQGGIYDHLGGGFSRYSVDDRWLAPHFEKMLYDNALLLELLTEAWRETAEPLFARRIAETVEWLAREMTGDDGAFASSLDADSEGEEGRFYVWSAAEILDLLGAQDYAVFAKAYDVTEGGNWEGKTILNRLHRLNDDAADAPEMRDALHRMRTILLRHREDRIRPGLDDKVLADWNGLMIAALARAGVVFGRADWSLMASRAFDAVVKRSANGDRLWHSHRAGKTTGQGVASDYANMTWAALRLYEVAVSTGATERADTLLGHAKAWQGVLDAHFAIEGGGYAFTADDTDDVIVRTRSARDDATPNANSIAIGNLVKLYQVTGNERFFERGEGVLADFRADIARLPLGHTGMLAAAIDLIHPMQAVIVGDDADQSGRLRAVLSGISLPGALELSVSSEQNWPDGSPLAGKTAASGEARVFLCAGPQCSRPLGAEDDIRGAATTERRLRPNA